MTKLLKINTVQSGEFDELRLYRKISWRILPFLLLCYVVSYLDRVNVGFAKLHMSGELGFSEAAYGFGAGIFFLGYILFEVPSNLVLARVGIRRTMSRIMIMWGLASIAMIFVQGPASFYTLRFLLGIFEAGFAPGMLYYLTCWYPARKRAQVMAIFLLAGPIGNSIGSPVSAWLIESLDKYLGLSGWQWMFIYEGMPSVILGVVAFFYLSDKPNETLWLSEEEKNYLALALKTDEPHAENHFRAALRSVSLYVYGFIYFGIISGVYAVSFWLPTLLKSFGVQRLQDIGWLSVVPNVIAIVAMLLNARSSDRHDERRWHIALPMFAGACGLCLIGFCGNVYAALGALVLATLAINAALAVFWAAPSARFAGTAAAGSIALVNSIGAFGGFVGPSILGSLKDLTGTFASGLFVIAALLAAGSLLALFFIAPRRSSPAAVPQVELA